MKSDSPLVSSVFREAGFRFALHYQTISGEESQKLKPEVRWKKVSDISRSLRYRTLVEMETSAIALLDQERENLFYAMKWSHRNAKWELVCQIADNLATYFNVRSYWPEWILFAELAIEDADSAGNLKLKVVALTNLSVVYRQLERWLESIRCCQEGISLCRQLKDRYGEGLSLGNLAGTFFAQNNLPDSFEHYETALRIFKKLGELYEQSQCLMGIGNVLAKQKALKEASFYLESSIKMQRKITDRFGEAQALNNLGIVRRMQKRFKEAIMNFQRSLQIKEEIGDQQGMANSLTNLAIAYEQSGQIDHAITTWERSLNLLKEVNFSDYEKASRRLSKLRLQIKTPN